LLELKIAESSGETTTMVGTLPVEVEDATEKKCDATWKRIGEGEL